MPHIIILNKVKILQGTSVIGEGSLQSLVTEAERLHDWLHDNAEPDLTIGMSNTRSAIEGWLRDTENALTGLCDAVAAAKTSGEAITT